MSYKVVSTEIFLRLIAAIALAVPTLLVVIATLALPEPVQRTDFILDGFQWLVLGLATALVLRGLFVLGETCDDLSGGVWVKLRPQGGAV